MDNRILPLLNSFILRRKLSIYSGKQTIAGILLGERTVASNVAGRVITWYTPFFSNVAGRIILNDVYARTIACKLWGFKRAVLTIAGNITACVRATVAGIFALQYQNVNRVAGAFKWHFHVAGTCAGRLFVSVKQTVAGAFVPNKVQANTVSGAFSMNSQEAHTIAGAFVVREPSWEQSMSGI